MTQTDKPKEFELPTPAFQGKISKGGPHPPEADRYVLYTALVCPYSARSIIARKLKGLESVITLAICHTHKGKDGFAFKPSCQFCTPDPVYDAELLSEVYRKADPDYAGPVSVPMLYDRKAEKVVSNHSGDILRMVGEAFNELLDEEHASLNLCPDELREEIDQKNDWVYNRLNNGVYKTGFATVQEIYDKNLKILFESLDELEKTFQTKDFVVGEGRGQLTEVDLRLFPTIMRFDCVYHGLFKCNLRTIRYGYPHIDRWARNLYWNYPAFREATNFDHIRLSYFDGARHLNPSGVVARGPQPDILGPL